MIKKKIISKPIIERDVMKDIYENLKLKSFIIMNLESFSSKIRSKTRMSTLTACIQHCVTGLARVIRQEKERKSNHIGKEE